MKLKVRLIVHSETKNEKIHVFFRNRINNECILKYDGNVLHLYDENQTSFKPNLWTSVVVRISLVKDIVSVETRNTLYVFKILETIEN